VRSALALAALGLIGCGRVGVPSITPDATPDTADVSVDGAPDAPPYPAAICDLKRIAVDATPAAADLAIAPVSEGFAVVWVDTATPRPAHGVLLGPNLQMLGMRTIPEVQDLALGGIADVGQKLVLASATGATQKLNILGRDLAIQSVQSTLINRLMGRDPYPSDANGLPHAFLSAEPMQVVMSNVAEDGLVDPAIGTFGVQGTITELACSDGPNHGHCVWAEQLGTPDTYQCTIADIFFNRPAPVVGGTIVWPGYCAEIRNASGPVSADSMIVVWTTKTHSVEAHYAVSTGDKLGTIAPMGFAPKVTFDGGRFWIAYLDGARQLRLASFDLNGTIVDYSLAGWTPLGNEAFELVHRNMTTALVVLSAGELDVLKICN
jgi:hypothetical protein